MSGPLTQFLVSSGCTQLAIVDRDHSEESAKTLVEFAVGKLHDFCHVLCEGEIARRLLTLSVRERPRRKG